MKHGETVGGKASPEYNSWRGMIDRCHNPSNPSYPAYSGRGVLVCDLWRRSFEAFLDHVGRRPSPKHSIELVNDGRNYEPGNVRWATYAEQNTNRRATKQDGAVGTTKRNFRVSDDLWDRVLEKATAEGRTASDIIRQLITEWVER